MKNKPLVTDLQKALGNKANFYRGYWVAIRFDKVISHSDALVDLLKNIGDTEAVVIFIPKEEEAHYGV